MRKLVGLLCCASVAVFGGAGYSVVVLPSPSGLTGVLLSGINNSGQVTGYGTDASMIDRSLIASPSGVTVLPSLPGWTRTTSFAINNAGQIAGFVLNGGATQAFLGNASGITLIPLPTGWTSSSARGINDSGQVTGAVYANNELTSRPFIWSAAAGTTLLPLAPGWANAFGSGINSSGQVTGTICGSCGALPQSTFIGTPSSSTVLALPSGFFYANGYAIDDAGQVAGTGAYLADNPSSYTQAFVSTTAGSTVIPLPPVRATDRYITSPLTTMALSLAIAMLEDGFGMLRTVCGCSLIWYRRDGPSWVLRASAITA